LAEAHYYFQLRVNDEVKTLAIVTTFGPPDPWLFEASRTVLYSCKSLDDEGLVVVDTREILSVISMVPHRPEIPGKAVEDRYFLHEKIGLEVAKMGGYNELFTEE
jgi:hypothetical protein